MNDLVLKYNSKSMIFNDPTNKFHRGYGDHDKTYEWNENQRNSISSAKRLNPMNFSGGSTRSAGSYSRYDDIELLQSLHEARKKNHLAAVKTGIFNPFLPTLRKMDRDNATCKLSDELARNTTALNRVEYEDATLRALNKQTYDDRFEDRSRFFDENAYLDELISQSKYKMDARAGQGHSYRPNGFEDPVPLDMVYPAPYPKENSIYKHRTDMNFRELRGLYQNYRNKVKLNLLK